MQGLRDEVVLELTNRAVGNIPWFQSLLTAVPEETGELVSEQTVGNRVIQFLECFAHIRECMNALVAYTG